jgi:hypothetical protein
MRDELTRKFEVLEAIREQVASRMAGVPDEKLQSPPAPGKWSPVQVVMHLAAAEGSSLTYIRKKTSDPGSVPPANFMCAVRTLLLRAAMSSPFRFKVPDVISGTPEIVPAGSALDRWMTVREELRSMIETMPEDLMKRAVFKHPVAGRMTMSQALEFMISHARRHAKQIEQALG